MIQPRPTGLTGIWGYLGVYLGVYEANSLPLKTGYPQMSPITDVALRKAKARDKPYKIAAGSGLYLLVNPIGSKLWRLKYRVSGKEKLLALGAYPTVPLQA